jgi:hypothetical protein
MYRVKRSLLGWAATIMVALIVYAFHVAPALAGDSLTLSHEAASGTTTFVGLGPVGPGCNATTGGPNCSFYTTSFTASGNAEPGGPFTQTGTVTTFFGLNGSAITLNGSIYPSIGAPLGQCAPTFSTARTVYANGTSDANSTGTTCCAATPPAAITLVCGYPLALGPPSTTQVSGLCTSGTGKYAGTQCSSESTSSSIDGVHFLSRASTVFTNSW